MNLNHFLKTCSILLVGMFVLILPAGLTSCSPERSASVRKTEKEKARKDKEARKEYDKAVRQHMKRQSDETRSMMKKTKKETTKNTPLKPTSGKKCK